jgi:hypothetical protein
VDTQQETRAAATFTGRLWTAIMRAGAFGQAIRLPGVFSPAWLARGRIICGTHDSDGGASSAGRHCDLCPSVVVQIRRAKTWHLWPGPREPGTLATMAGTCW